MVELAAEFCFLTGMPLYYLDFRYDAGHALTDYGMWFPDLDAAEREAKEIAAKVKTKLGVGSVTACIRDQHKIVQRELVVSD